MQLNVLGTAKHNSKVIKSREAVTLKLTSTTLARIVTLKVIKTYTILNTGRINQAPVKIDKK